jgi:hypothetical protein
MKELLRGESTISLEAAVLKCPNAELYLFLPYHEKTSFDLFLGEATDRKPKQFLKLQSCLFVKRY